MGLRDRLERHLGPANKSGKTSTDVDKDNKLDMLRKRLAELDRSFEDRSKAQAQEPVVVKADLLSAIPGGRIEKTPFGECFVSRTSQYIGDFHGNRRLRDFLSVSGELAARITGDRSLSRLNPQSVLFLDTETTGLAGGSGTYAFLIGLGFVEGDNFVVLQIFMRDYSEEAAALHILANMAERFETLATFNGKTFDVGLLSTRLVMNRMPDRLSTLPHYDLLHPAKRIYRHRLENCRLSTLEEQVLGVRRIGDIPGSEIPPLCFQFVRQHDANLVRKVFEHNRLDVISMTTLAAQLQSVWRMEDEACLAPEDWLGIGLCLSNAMDLQNAVNALTRALDGIGDGEKRRSAMRELVIVLKRLELYEESAGRCRAWIDSEPPCNDHFPYEELAKHFEHRVKDYEAALSLTEKALEICKDPDGHTALLHRRNRLRGKIKGAANT